MARIKTEHKIATSEFQSLSQEAALHNEKNDCWVKAFVVATDCTYAEARGTLGAFGRKPRHGMYRAAGLNALAHKGVNAAYVNPADMIAKYSKAKTGNYVYKSVTPHHVELYPEAWNDGHIYMLFTNGHVLTVKNGKVHDWTRGRSFRVVSIYRLSKKEVA
jgi:hypothetical protein